MHRRFALSVALQVVRDRDDAEDVCQEAFLRVHRSLDQFERQSRFTTWLYRIVFNLGLDHLRRRRAAAVLDERVQSHDPAPRLDALGVDRALATLSTNHRDVLVLREIEGMSYAEISRVMNCPIGTVMSRLHHARRQMQSQLPEFAP